MADRPSISSILDTADDFELCNELLKWITSQHGDQVDASLCNGHEQVVVLVWHASGIVGNGGFQYLFEGDFNGDPYFAKTAAAFRAIGAHVCADAIDEALAIFPDSKPPTNIEARLKAYQKAAVPIVMNKMDLKFFSQKPDIRHLLARYIRSHRDGFLRLV